MIGRSAIQPALLFFFCVFFVSEGISRASISLFDDGNTKFTVGGAISLDAMSDSTRSFNDLVGGAPVQPANTAAGANSRLQFSPRDSRVYSQVNTESSGVKYQGILHLDAIGYDPQPTGIPQTEGGYFLNPTIRVLLADFQAEKDGWGVLAGLAGELFGWQPFYYQTVSSLWPFNDQLFNRTLQFRLMKTFDFDSSLLQSAISFNRPPQRDSGLPDLQAGLRYVYNGWKASATVGPEAVVAPQALSVGISGLAREIVVPTPGGGPGDITHIPATAIAVNAFVPIIPVAAGADTPHSLSFMASWTTGRGYGDQFIFYSGNAAGNLSEATNTTSTAYSMLKSPQGPVNLDGSLGDYDASGTFHLTQITCLNASFQYMLPLTAPTWIDFGYNVLASNNMYQLVGTNGLTSAGLVPYGRDEAWYANFFRDINSHVRVALEYVHSKTEYSNGAEPGNNRYQVGAYYLF